MNLIDIGELSRRSGMPPSALRYYEEVGLIRPDGRKGLRRQYGPETLTQLTLITMGKLAGFSLDEISAMFSAGGAPALPRLDLQQRADQIDRQIKSLTTLSKALRHVAECPAPSHMECPSFQRLMRLAPSLARREAS